MLVASTAEAREPRLLISAAELAKGPPSFIGLVLDARDAESFRAGRIPGALNVDIREWTACLSDPKTRSNAGFWSTRLGAFGIKDEKTPVVVYSESAVPAARLWWTLRYLGLKNVAILDGGWTAWRVGKHPISARTSLPVKPQKYVGKIDKSRIAVTSEVRQCLGKKEFQLLDTRSIGEWKRGRIPGATRLEWKELMAKDGRYRPVAELKKLFRERGLDPKKTLVPY